MKERFDEAEQFQSQKRNLIQHLAPSLPSSFVQGAEKADVSGSDYATVSRSHKDRQLTFRKRP